MLYIIDTYKLLPPFNPYHPWDWYIYLHENHDCKVGPHLQDVLSFSKRATRRLRCPKIPANGE